MRLLLNNPVPLVSFTFGIPDPADVSAFREAGTITVQTGTSGEEAAVAAAVGVDALAVRASAAAAAAADGNPEFVSLWAGTGYRNPGGGPLRATIERLATAICAQPCR